MSIDAYRTSDGQDFANDDRIATPKDVAQTTGKRESDGRSDGPSSNDPGNVRRVSKICADIYQDGSYQAKAARERAYVGERQGLVIEIRS